MDLSFNAWATPTEQSQPLPDLQVMLARNHHTNATPSAPANPYEAIIEKLTQEIQTLKSNANSRTAPSKSRPAKVKEAPSTKSKASKAAGPSSTATPKKKQPMNTTPKHGEREASSPPNLTHEKTPFKIKKPTQEVVLVKPSPKQHPQQMQTHDFPPGFTPTKGGRIKFGKSVIHLGSNFISYAQALLSQLGLRVWCPNLEKDSASLYNAAHRIAALTKFTELASTTAYTYLKVDPEMATDMSLWRNTNKSKNNVVRLPKKQPTRKSTKIKNSDDEEVPGKGYYRIKTLCYCSTNANCFSCQLEAVMLKKYWEVLAEPYGLLEAKSSSDKESEENDENGEEGEGIDLTKPSPHNCDDEYYGEGEGGHFYDDDVEEFLNDEEEGVEESSGSDAENTEKDLDEDYTMAPIPEADKDCKGMLACSE
ncbi:hypothetical protein VP01_887g12 [Puccinia sorghi]|uniref:Uncharacterized protein n=1 Tax=Puccinia sorghi TaxID=27349 RepID=A0A0L6U8X6_9BASI|nr:hypothetical protein VP01_887g12 [Puccinia sorghi]